MAIHQLKHTRIDAATTLRSSPPLRRLQANMQDLILVALETFTRTHGQSYALSALHYVYDEKNDGKFSMHFDAQAKDLELNASIPLSLVITVKVGDNECYPHS